MKNIFLKIIIISISLINITGCNNTANKNAVQGNDYDNTKIQWGLKKIEGAPPQLPSSWSELLRRFDGYYIGDITQKKLYLTFDEGYENGYTGKILDILKESNVPAAFFITGPYVDKEKDLVLRMVNEGHIVGNHTINHPSMPDVKSDAKLEDEINSLNKKFYDLTGATMIYVRPPRGEFSERTLAISKNLGYKTILWSNAYLDWVSNKNSEQRALEQVTKYFHNGSIILLHAVSEENTKALPEIINSARIQGYTFASLDDL